MSTDSFKNITMQQMEAIISLAQEGSFSRAAKKMLLTQPALTKNIKNIEILREAYHRAYIFGTCARYCQELLIHVEFEYMLDVAEAILLGALRREETRGSHYRTDFPVRDDQSWLKHTIQTWTEVGPRIVYENVDATKYKPEERKY